MNIQELAVRLSDLQSFQGYEFECQPIPGEVEVLQVTVGEFAELPSFVSVTDTQILCITWLFAEDEVKEESRAAMMEEMLELNIPIPLSAFAKVDNRYVIYGALSINSSIEDICQELVSLSENAVEAITVLEEFLK
ncbi:MAG: DUF2170 family protein [Pseudomonadales bacterium]